MQTFSSEQGKYFNTKGVQFHNVWLKQTTVNILLTFFVGLETRQQR